MSKTPLGIQNLNFRPLNTTESNLLVFSEDQNLEKIDMALYAFGNVFKGLLTQSIVDYVVSQSQSKPNSNISLASIFNQFPGLEAAINSGLANQNINSIPYDFSSLNKILAVLQRNGISYNIGLNIPNMGKFGSTTNYVLSSNLELEDEPGHSDQVMAWLKQGGAITAIRVDETEAMTFGTAILNVNLNRVIPIGGFIPYDPPSADPNGDPDRYINLVNLRPWVKFEKKGASEIWLHCTYRLTGGWSYEFSGYGRSLITTKDMGTWHNINKSIGLYIHDFLWNIYEKDWWAGAKAINMIQGTNLEATNVSMKFDGEVYAVDPAENYPNYSHTPTYSGGFRSTISPSTPTYLNGYAGNANFNFLRVD